MIRGVEHLRPELKRMPLSDAKVLDRRDVEVHLFWSNQVVAPAIAEQRHNGVGEGRRIEPSMGSWIGEYGIHAGNTIEAVAHRESGARRIPRTGIERLAALRGSRIPQSNFPWMVQSG